MKIFKRWVFCMPVAAEAFFVVLGTKRPFFYQGSCLGGENVCGK